ncbi:hypothetical protein Y032_0023g693 [Ancylostoma ceylanicum]|uniref:Uncharacterized protein n=1 Tax=Ancylostoma ceylanicum TaxID=53326 RepID=A0A016UX23_9BILA|nr:hypothetical protein Y032_0023g693 [Ancylostoma ceylanicum]
MNVFDWHSIYTMLDLPDAEESPADILFLEFYYFFTTCLCMCLCVLELGAAAADILFSSAAPVELLFCEKNTIMARVSLTIANSGFHY